MPLLLTTFAYVSFPIPIGALTFPGLPHVRVGTPHWTEIPKMDPDWFPPVSYISMSTGIRDTPRSETFTSKFP